MYQAPTYIPGQPWFCCDRCGEQKRLSMIAKEWTGLLVCRDTCLDPKPPEMTPPKVWPEGVAMPDARPYPTPVYVGPGDVAPGDL